MKLGIHVSISGGIDQAVLRAADLGCNTFQIFLSSPHSSWNKAEINEDAISLFKSLYKKHEMENAVAHSIYLINLATTNLYNLDKSINSLIADLELINKLGISALVTHIGSCRDSDSKTGINTAIDSIQKVLSKSDASSCLLLENTAGAGNLIGDSVEELAEIIAAVDSEKIGICIDTAHAFESGYRLNEEKGLNDFIEKIDKLIGLDKLKAIHLNDSITPLGSNRDRHEEFGLGMIGEEGMTRIIKHPALKNLPFIMETPQIKKGESGKELVDRVRTLQKA